LGISFGARRAFLFGLRAIPAIDERMSASEVARLDLAVLGWKLEILTRDR
jgi:hypothetical protein